MKLSLLLTIALSPLSAYAGPCGAYTCGLDCGDARITVSVQSTHPAFAPNTDGAGKIWLSEIEKADTQQKCAKIYLQTDGPNVYMGNPNKECTEVIATQALGIDPNAEVTVEGRYSVLEYDTPVDWVTTNYRTGKIIKKEKGVCL